MRRGKSLPWIGAVVAFNLVAIAWSEEIKFVVIGDFGKRVQTNGVATLIQQWNPGFVITVGDNSYSDGHGGKNGFETDVVPAFSDFINAGKFFPCLGNHDFMADGGGYDPKRLEFYLQALKPPQAAGTPGGGRYYEFNKGTVRFFVINSNDEGPDDRRFSRAQGDWLRQGLKAAMEPFKVVCFHHPPYSAGKYRPGVVGMRWPFKEWGASLVLSGHDHNYQHWVRRGLHYVVNGLGGDSLYPVHAQTTNPGAELKDSFAGRYGAMLVTADEKQMKLTMTTVKKLSDGKMEEEAHEPIIITAGTSMPEPLYRDLKKGMRGVDVEAWQDFLFEGKWLASQADEKFGSKTQDATLSFQKQHQLTETGELDKATRGKAAQLGHIPAERPE